MGAMWLPALVMFAAAVALAVWLIGSTAVLVIVLFGLSVLYVVAAARDAARKT
jgi:hypothetical protein